MNAERSIDGPPLTGVAAGEPPDFDALVALTQRRLLAFAWRYLHNDADAEEVVIEAYVRLHQARARLRPDTNLTAWLFTALANLCHNRHRWRTRHREVSLDADQTIDENAATSASPSAALQRDEISAAVRAAVDRLPHDQRTVVLLHHYEQLSYREIGAIVGCSERGVETRLYRALRRLRAELGDFIEPSAPAS